MEDQVNARAHRLRVKRCHYCDLPMRERVRTLDGVVVGTYWWCPEGCS